MAQSFKKPSPELQDAYDMTLKHAVNSPYKKDEFYCSTLRCAGTNCPFAAHGHCIDENDVDGAGYKRTFAEWQEWWYKLTGINDERLESGFITEDLRIMNSNNSTTEEKPAESPEFSQEILLNIRWNLVDGIEIKKQIRIEELSDEIKKFQTELNAWLLEMAKPIAVVNAAFTNRMHFEACTTKLGKTLVKYDFNSQMFGKRKVWAEL